MCPSSYFFIALWRSGGSHVDPPPARTSSFTFVFHQVGKAVPSYSETRRPKQRCRLTARLPLRGAAVKELPTGTLKVGISSLEGLDGPKLDRRPTSLIFGPRRGRRSANTPPHPTIPPPRGVFCPAHQCVFLFFMTGYVLLSIMFMCRRGRIKRQ